MQRLKYFSIFIFGLVTSLYFFFSINGKYTQKDITTVENASVRAKLRIAEEISKINLVIESMGFFFEHSNVTSPVLFDQFTDPFMRELYGIKALSWAPRVPDSTRIRYLKRVGRQYENFTNIKEEADNKQLVIADSGSTYYPMTFINPLGPHEKIMGYDMYSDSTRRSVINRAIRTGAISFSPPVELIRQAGGGIGFLAMKSVNYPGSSDGKGIVLCIYRMDLFIEKTLASELKVIEIGIYDKAAGNALLYSNIQDDPTSSAQDKAAVTIIEAGDRKWNISFLPKKKITAFPHAFESYIVLLLTLVATFLLIAVVKKRDDYNTTLEQKVGWRTVELQESNKMKENLLREIHHRVKNNLQITSSLMNMQKRKLTSQEAITALENSQSRISAIALTHQKIYQDKDSKAVNLSEYLTDLMAYQKRIAPSVQYTIQCPDTSIDLDRAVPLALIISELVTNALKHAYDNMLEDNELIIKARDLKDDMILLTISDNGRGLPPDFNIKKADGIGFEIIHSLCRQISAELSYESCEKGTVFKITFSNRAKPLQKPLLA